MVFVACGLNHKTAPLEMRERVAFDASRHYDLLQSLTALPCVQEAVILSTCNRTELYCETTNDAALLEWLAHLSHVPINELMPHVYCHHDLQAVKHALSVASGLDSMMLGEPQIFGQLKLAYQTAQDAGAVKTSLRALFDDVFSASKRIRTQSGIGKNPISAAYAAVQLIKHYFKHTQSLSVLLIGSGETAQLAAKYLQQEGVHQFFVASRTLENAKKMAEAFQAIPLAITDIAHHLPKSDVVITATACPLPFINQNMVMHSLEERANRPMFFLDLAVPRDIEPSVGELTHVALYNVDDLSHITMQGKQERESAAKKAHLLVEHALEHYTRKHRALKANQHILAYRHRMQETAFEELQRARQKLIHGALHTEVLDELCHRLLQKLLHHPCESMRQAAVDGNQAVLDLTHYLFNTQNQELTYEEVT